MDNQPNLRKKHLSKDKKKNKTYVYTQKSVRIKERQQENISNKLKNKS